MTERHDSTPAPAEAAQLGPVLEFLRSLWALDHALQRASKRMTLAIGVTGPQRLVVRIVGRFPGISAGELARVMHVHPSTLTGVLDRLEKRRLIRRVSDPRDARRSLFRLTAAGERIDATLAGTIEGFVKDVLERTPRDRWTAAETVINEITRELQERARGEAGGRGPRGGEAPAE
jgi:DNA-binding MarR family transcriptional regulator